MARQLGVGLRERVGRILQDHLLATAEVKHKTAPRNTDKIRKIAWELAADEAVDSKELFESLEFYLRVRKRVRRHIMLDFGCGHGLAGLLFGENTVEIFSSTTIQSF